jgi:nanoRNase/pAp phosphatase (c-di-AMP/oligoRNAs hydrolase)
MSFKEILQALDEAQAKRVLLLCHHNSDPDAICSAYALQNLLLRAKPDLQVEIGAGQGVSKLTKNLVGYIPVTINFEPNIEAADALFLVDTNTVQQLDNLAEAVGKSKAPLILVDHHAPHPETVAAAKVAIVDDQAPSTCNLIYNLYREQGVKPNLDEARALFLGMAFDTRHFVLANGRTFRAITEMLDTGLDTQEALSMLTVPTDISERIARVKAIERAKFVRVGSWIIAVSHVSAFQASVARALIDVGAHVSAVAGEKDNGIEISFRCTREFNQKTGIHLGTDIAKPLGESLKGQGGGHAMAAGVNARGTERVAVQRCLKLLKEKLAKTE